LIVVIPKSPAPSYSDFIEIPRHREERGNEAAQTAKGLPMAALDRDDKEGNPERIA
jgi:hypothetical protein